MPERMMDRKSRQRAAAMASRLERQRRTAAMTKCGCGNVAARGSSLCGRCEEEERELREADQKQANLRFFFEAVAASPDIPEPVKQAAAICADDLI